MRIISGKRKGIMLKSPEGETTRPTADRVKEGLFSAIQFDLADAVVLDAFAGSGQLSLEALSRGASFAVLCEKEKGALKVIAENIKKTESGSSTEVLPIPVEQATEQLKQHAPFTLVFLDPPYKSLLWADTIKMLETEKLLSDHCILVCECPREYSFPEEFERYQQREYRYGSTKVVVLRK